MKALIALILILTACGKEESKSSPASVVAPVVAPSLVGTWKSGCIDLNSGWKTIITLKNTETVSILDTVQYYNDNCNVPRILDRTTRTYEVKNASLVAGAFDINMLTQKVERNYFTKEYADLANKDKGFGYSDWTSLGVKDITGLRYSAAYSYQAKANSMVYLIFKIDGSTYYGSDMTTGDGTTEALRPNKLNSSISLIKQ